MKQIILNFVLLIALAATNVGVWQNTTVIESTDSELRSSLTLVTQELECVEEELSSLKMDYEDFKLKDTTLLETFGLEELSSPDEKNSWKKMDGTFVSLLKEAEAVSGFRWRINSGYRTCSHNKNLIKRGYKAAKNSWHMDGNAVDISASTSAYRKLILNSLKHIGIVKGIKVYPAHIHVQWKNDHDLWNQKDLIAMK
jgi:uncharacterized protein YcbK (DUF882 family)